MYVWVGGGPTKSFKDKVKNKLAGTGITIVRVPTFLFGKTTGISNNIN